MTQHKNTIGRQDYVTIGAAAQILGASIDTLRRWERAGRLTSTRLDGKNRYFAVKDLQAFAGAQQLTTGQVAGVLGISEATVRRLEQAGTISAERSDSGRRLFNAEQIRLYAAMTSSLLAQQAPVAPTRQQQLPMQKVSASLGVDATIQTGKAGLSGSKIPRVNTFIGHQDRLAVEQLARNEQYAMPVAYDTDDDAISDETLASVSAEVEREVRLPTRHGRIVRFVLFIVRCIRLLFRVIWLIVRFVMRIVQRLQAALDAIDSDTLQAYLTTHTDLYKGIGIVAVMIALVYWLITTG